MNRKNGIAMPFKAVEVPQGNTPEVVAARPDFCLPHQPPVAAFEFPSGRCVMQRQHNISTACPGLLLALVNKIKSPLYTFGVLRLPSDVPDVVPTSASCSCFLWY
jgi:hypothetical protein